MHFLQLISFGIGFLQACHAWPHHEGNGLPIIDLGYEIYQATSYNASTGIYKFANVRFARSPAGELRFRAPQPPKINRSVIQNGLVERICPQAVPTWQNNALTAIESFTHGEPFSQSAWEASIAKGISIPISEFLKHNTEDCLFLDVYVPRKVLEHAQKHPGGTKNVPVLFWIFGGGFFLGSKLSTPVPQYFPDGLLKYGQQESESGFIYVATNYRLGTLGFLSGSEIEKDGNLNAGLLDQRFALDWVQKYIHLFGGSRDLVTVMGESAGGGSTMIQAAAYGGKKGHVPFQRAIPQSPAELPGVSDSALFKAFLSTINATTLAEARKAPSEVIIAGNAKLIGDFPANGGIGPVVDHDFIPAPVSELYRKGAFDKRVAFLTGVNSYEGSFFYDPKVKTEADFGKWMTVTIGLTPAQVEKTRREYYPPIYDGSLGYTDIATRQGLVFADAVFYCSAALINDKSPIASYAYEFSVKPGIHTEDTAYTFTVPVPYPKAQVALQRAIASFAVHGVPKAYSGHYKGVPFPKWDSEHNVINFTTTGYSLGKKFINQTRCDWWKRGILE